MVMWPLLDRICGIRRMGDTLSCQSGKWWEVASSSWINLQVIPNFSVCRLLLIWNRARLINDWLKIRSIDNLNPLWANLYTINVSKTIEIASQGPKYWTILRPQIGSFDGIYCQFLLLNFPEDRYDLKKCISLILEWYLETQT